VIGGGNLQGLAAVVAIDAVCTLEEEADIQINVQKSINVLNKNLKPAMHILRFFITRVAFTPETGLVTRNLKVDRDAVRLFFEKNFVSETKPTNVVQ
jgi:long-subunit acyl-CoA synthetase (AMP-forming)